MPSEIITIPIIIVLMTTTIPRLLKPILKNQILSHIWNIKSIPAHTVVMTPKNHTNFSGKNEKDVMLLTASLKSFR